MGEGQIPREAAYWHWKHEQNPFGRSPVLLAEADGKLIGLRAFMRWEWDWRGRRVPAVRAVDTATHPDARGKGLFSKLTLRLLEQMKEQGVAFVFNTPNRFSMPGYLKMGWGTVGRVSLWLRPIRPLRMVRGFRRVQGSDGEEGAEELTVGRPVGELLREPELAAFLAGVTGSNGRLSTARTVDYLRWRYQEIVGFTYRAVWKFAAGAGALFIVRAKRQGALTELRICEALVGPDDASVAIARGLLRTLIARGGEVDYASAMATPESAAARALAANGFVPARLGPTLTAKRLNGQTDLLARSAWNLGIGDLEIF